MTIPDICIVLLIVQVGERRSTVVEELPKILQAISNTETETNPAGRFSFQEGTQARRRRGLCHMLSWEDVACGSGHQIWLCRLGYAQGQLACGLSGAECSPSPLTNHAPGFPRPPTLVARLCLFHTEGTLSAASASLTGSGGRVAEHMEPSDGQSVSMRVLCALEGSFVHRKTNWGCYGFKNECLVDKSNKFKNLVNFNSLFEGGFYNLIQFS